MKILQLTNLRSYVEQEMYTAVMLITSAYIYRYYKAALPDDLIDLFSDPTDVIAHLKCLGIVEWPLNTPLDAPDAPLALSRYIKHNISLKILDDYYTSNFLNFPDNTCFTFSFVSQLAVALSKMQTPELALAFAELIRQLILHGEKLHFLNRNDNAEDFIWFLTEMNRCAKNLTTEETISLVSLITQQIKLRKPELILSKGNNETAVIRYFCTLAANVASKRRLPGKWGSFARPQKEKTRHIIVSRTPPFKKSLMLVPGESTRDVQTMLFSNLGTLDSHWTLVERKPAIMKVIQKRSPFPEDYSNINLHLGDYSTFDTDSIPPLDFIWLDQLGNFRPKQLSKLKNFNLDMSNLDFWITFNYFPRNNRFFHKLKELLLQRQDSLNNELRKIKLVSDIDPNFRLNIVTQWILLNYIFEMYHFDTEVFLYADQMAGKTPIYMVLFHLNNFTRRGRPFWATSIIKKLLSE